MKARLSIQHADYSDHLLGPMTAAKALTAFDGIDWDALRADARALRDTDGDFCLPGLYIQYDNFLPEQRILLHLYCTYLDAELRFDLLETDTINAGLANSASRPPPDDRYGKELDRNAARAEIQAFYEDLPDKIVLRNRTGLTRPYATYRQSMKNTKTMLGIGLACLAVSAAILAYTLYRFPALQPDWLKSLLIQAL